MSDSKKSFWIQKIETLYLEGLNQEPSMFNSNDEHAVLSLFKTNFSKAVALRKNEE